MKTLYIVPTDTNTGLTSVSLGLIQALDTLSLKAGFLKPISLTPPDQNRSVRLVNQVHHLPAPKPLHIAKVQQHIQRGELDRVLEDVVALHRQVAESSESTDQGSDLVVMEGLIPDRAEPFTTRLNIELARALNAEVILVLNGEQSQQELRHTLDAHTSLFQHGEVPVSGYIVNRSTQAISELQLDSKFLCLGAIPWTPLLNSPRTQDLLVPMQAEALHLGEIATRRVQSIHLGARTLKHTLPELTAGTLLVTPSDRDELILAAATVASQGTPLAGLLLTDGGTPCDVLMPSCQVAWQTGLPVMTTGLGMNEVAARLNTLSSQIPEDDIDRIRHIMHGIADHLDREVLTQLLDRPENQRLSPAAFRFNLVQQAKAIPQRIVLPEGDEPRTLQAAIHCQQRGIANCVLLGNPVKIQQLADAYNLTLPENLEVYAPDTLAPQYTESLMERRRHKQLSRDAAMSMLEDSVMLGTMMLAEGDVDGLVSGAVHTTANTIRPALQLIKTASNAKLVSSVFFMGLPDQVVVYGDCAVNPDPSAEELADIAIQSADSAMAMGIPARVAMISYSTGQSGSGIDVDKVRQATALIQQIRPDISVDGPLQYDAATNAAVARSKAPDSQVAGRATVLVFPDLNTGNTTYKAVQRTAHVISIGPMLQGLARPVNDLSRGASVEDIIYTIALTAIQAQKQNPT